MVEAIKFIHLYLVFDQVSSEEYICSVYHIKCLIAMMEIIECIPILYGFDRVSSDY